MQVVDYRTSKFVMIMEIIFSESVQDAKSFYIRYVDRAVIESSQIRHKNVSQKCAKLKFYVYKSVGKAFYAFCCKRDISSVQCIVRKSFYESLRYRVRNGV